VTSVALVSLEPWDDVWRRNQHLTAQLLRSGAVDAVDFLEPAQLLAGRRATEVPLPGVSTLPTSLRFPKRAGGLIELGRRLRRTVLRTTDVLWVNDPQLGVHCLQAGQRAVYDVTDDWRSYDFPPRVLRRIIRAEDILARHAVTVVCSAELKERWRSRYGVEAAVVHNGVDSSGWAEAEPRVFPGPGPHVGYVGTLQPERLDVELVTRVADDRRIGRVHLIGPDALDDTSRTRLAAHPKITIHGPVPSHDVPSWTKGLDVLLSPHVVTPFTLSLDAIKSYEYLASGRPVVATATSGFQLLANRPGVHVATSRGFAEAVGGALAGPRSYPTVQDIDWSARARQFAEHLLGASPAHPPARSASTSSAAPTEGRRNAP
jgi:teichuronic acid biosynthesis glycosyltransferase TuaH